MTSPPTNQRLPRFLPRAGRWAAIALTWLAVVAAGTAGFAATGLPQGRELRLDVMDVVGFGCPLAAACAVAAAVELAAAGKRAGALEVALVIAAVSAVLAAGGYILLWPAPSIVRSTMGWWEFEQLRNSVWRGAYTGAWVYLPLGAVVGGVAGVAAGLLAVLARGKPRVALALAFAVLGVCAFEPAQQAAAGLVAWWGLAVMRLDSGWSWAAPTVLASGAAAGALAGSALASFALWYRGKTVHLTGTASAHRPGRPATISQVPGAQRRL